MIHIPDKRTVDKVTIRDEKKMIYKLQKLKEFSENAAKLNRKDFLAKVPIQSFLDDTLDVKAALRQKDAELQDYKKYLEDNDILYNIDNVNFNKQRVVNRYFNKEVRPKVNVRMKDPKTLQKQTSEYLLRQNVKRQTTVTLEDNYFNKLKMEEFNELLSNDLLGSKPDEKEKHKSFIINKYSKCRFTNTLYDLKLSRCRAQSCSEYLAKFPNRFSEAYRKNPLNNVDESFIFKEVNSLLDECQQEIQDSNFLYNVNADEETKKISKLGTDPYKSVCATINQRRRFAKYQVDYLSEDIIDPNVQKKLVMAKLQSLLGDKYLKQMFATVMLHKIEQETLDKMRDPDVINKYKFNRKHKNRKKSPKTKTTQQTNEKVNKEPKKEGNNNFLGNIFNPPKLNLGITDPPSEIHPTNETLSQTLSKDPNQTGETLSRNSTRSKSSNQDDKKTDEHLSCTNKSFIAYKPKQRKSRMNNFPMQDVEIPWNHITIPGVNTPYNKDKKRSSKVYLNNTLNDARRKSSFMRQSSRFSKRDGSENSSQYDHNDSNIGYNDTKTSGFQNTHNQRNSKIIDNNIFLTHGKSKMSIFTKTTAHSQKKLDIGNNQHINEKDRISHPAHIKSKYDNVINKNYLDAQHTKLEHNLKCKISENKSLFNNPFEEFDYNLDKLKKYKYLSQTKQTTSKVLHEFFQEHLWDKNHLTEKIKKVAYLGITGMLIDQGIIQKQDNDGYGKYFDMKIESITDNLGASIKKKKKRHPTFVDAMDKFTEFTNKFNGCLKANANLDNLCTGYIEKLEDNGFAQISVPDHL